MKARYITIVSSEDSFYALIKAREVKVVLTSLRPYGAGSQGKLLRKKLSNPLFTRCY